jgi:hypothetical protein
MESCLGYNNMLVSHNLFFGDSSIDSFAGAPNIKVTLQMSYEYLRLYTNAFAFQAAISQALHSKPKGTAHSQKEHVRASFSNIASMPDARFIYESIDAAKSYLTILNNFVNPKEHLHYMPLRYYLWVSPALVSNLADNECLPDIAYTPQYSSIR